MEKPLTEIKVGEPSTVTLECKGCLDGIPTESSGYKTYLLHRYPDGTVKWCTNILDKD